jgi:hypothetical protein
MKRLSILLLLAVVVGADACARGCDANLVPGISVTVVDKATGISFAGDVTVVATEGSYTETVHPPPLPAGPRLASLAYERPGTYRVEVQAPGYVTWVATNVRVTHDGCHVETVLLTAELELAGTN